MRFEVYCDESQQDLFAKAGEKRPGQRVVVWGIWIEASGRPHMQGEIARGAATRRLRRTAVSLAALVLFSSLSVLCQGDPCVAQAAAIGSALQVSGTVDSRVTRDSAGDWAWFYISEGGCRIRVYYDRGDLPWLAKGSRVLITGHRSEFNDEPQITAESVRLLESSTSSGNRLLLIGLVLSVVPLGALGVAAARLRRGRTRGHKTPYPQPDAETAGVDLRSAEARATRERPEDHETAAYSGQDSGQVLRKQENSRDNDSTTRLHRIKREHPRAYGRWSTEEDERLVEMTRSGHSVRQSAKTLERQPGAIRSRLKKLDQGNDPLDLPSDTEGVAEDPITERSLALRSGEIAFLPLAVSSMSGDAVCVAGLDINAQSWVRLVRQGMYSLNEADSTVFRDRSLMVVQVGARQVRPGHLDPRGLHTEDRVMEGEPRKLPSLGPGERLALLESAVDEDLERALSTKRSLFVVEPSGLRLIPRDGKQPKIAFETPTTSTDALRSSQSLERNLIGISSHGCPCNCLAWDKAPAPLRGALTHSDILKLCPDARVFLALSLTGWPLTLPPEKQKHYLLVAGIHVIGRDRVWL